MRSFAVLSFLAALAVVQASEQSPLIPSGISSGCTTFLNTMDTNSQLATCTAALVNATAAFAPGTNSTGLSAANVTATLNSVCSSAVSSACSQTTIRSLLASFQSACSSEITSNAAVITLYDTLYTMPPLQESLCSKDSSGTYCPLSTVKNSTVGASSSGSSNPSTSIGALWNALTTSNNGTNTTTYSVNAATWAKANLAFLMFEPTDSAAELCVPCLKDTLDNYVEWMSQTPYGPGTVNSQLLGGQSALIQAVESACGSDFLGSGTGNAGLSGSISTGHSGAASIGVNGLLATAAVAFTGMAVLL